MTISLVSEEGMLHLSIRDDGSGFTDFQKKFGATPGMGIKIMQYRARQLGASLEFLSHPEGGMEVRLAMRMV